MTAARRVVRAFPAAAEAVGLRPLAGGMINTSFLCTTADGGRFVLQRINPEVFPDPETLMAGQAAVCAHLERAAGRLGGAVAWQVPTPLPTGDGRPFHRDGDRGHWRLLRFIPGRPASSPSGAAGAERLGRGLGLFHAMLAGLAAIPPPAVPGFHRLSRYLAEYDAAVRAVGREDARAAGLRDLVARGREEFGVLEERWLAGDLGEQAIHGDPRCENFILAPDGTPVALVDLDTVMAGPPVLDLADCLRSCLAAGGKGRGALARALVRGWREGAAGRVACDLSFLPQALKCILFELGLRFFTDHLRGDRYFRVSRPGENLERSVAQFALISEVDGICGPGWHLKP